MMMWYFTIFSKYHNMFTIYIYIYIYIYHSIVADELLRGNNSIGKWTLQELTKSGVNVNGCDSTCYSSFTFYLFISITK